MSSCTTIVARLLSGDEYDLRKIDDEIDAWHDVKTPLGLHEWLGFTQDEYALYVEQPHLVKLILSSRARP